MRRSRSTSPSFVAAIACAALLASPRRAHAQACCAGGLAIAPARLSLGEDALFGIQTRVTDLYGSFDPRGHYVRSPDSTSEVDFEQDLVGTARVFEKAQVSVLAPVLESLRRVPGRSEAGGGFGDLLVTARYDFVLAGDSRRIPGIAISAGLTMPTGTAADSAHQPLATDATGTGAFQGSFALALEQSFRKVIVNITGSATLRSARWVQGVREQQGSEWLAFGAAGYMLGDGAVVAITASYTADLDARANGVPVPTTSSAFTRLGVAGGYTVDERWRVQGSAFLDPPIAHLGHNRPLGTGLGLMLVRSFS